MQLYSNNIRVIDSMPIPVCGSEELILVNVSKAKPPMEYALLKKKLISDLNFMHLLL